MIQNLCQGTYCAGNYCSACIKDYYMDTKTLLVCYSVLKLKALVIKALTFLFLKFELTYSNTMDLGARNTNNTLNEDVKEDINVCDILTNHVCLATCLQAFWRRLHQTPTKIS